MKYNVVMIAIVLGLVTVAHAQAEPYRRNEARAVNQVVFGKIDSVRNITQTQVEESEHSGWKTLGGALLGGLLGNQFGDGHGREVATAVGALAGAGAAQVWTQPQSHEYQLVEILIRDEKDHLINVIQDYDPAMIFSPGGKVRILYFDDGVRVDKTF